MTLPYPPADPTPARDPRDIERALAAFGLTVQAPPEHIGESVLNENYRVETNDGPRFLRFVRKERLPERVLLEHRVMGHAARAGIPVPLPHAVDGQPFVRVAGHLVQLYPWVEGRIAEQSIADAEVVGAMEAATHVALSGVTDPELPRASSASWDTEEAIQVLSRIDDLIRYYPSPGDAELHIQETLRFQLEGLESSAVRPPSDFDGLPWQACHADYHNRNVMLGPGADVVAVVDWEIINTIPPVFELLRAVSFSDYLDPPLLRAYLRGYATRRRLSAEECHLGVEMWWQSRLHATWIYRQRFIEGNRLVDRFFDQEAALLHRFSDPAYRTELSDQLRIHLT